MSILIKGMEMPKNCTECRFAVDGWCYGLTPTEPNSKSLATGTRPSWCPLIELPPHGRLIDADAFEEYECHHCDGYCDVCECDCLNCKSEHRCSFMQDFKDASTIIEAEGEDD